MTNLPFMKNAADIPFGSQNGHVPQLDGALRGWFQPITFILVQKAQSNGILVESGVATESWTAPDGTTITGQMITLMGSALKPKTRMLDIDKKGQRLWKGIYFHATPQVRLKNDDCIIFGVANPSISLLTQYRVQDVDDYSLYGEIGYFCLEDYQFSGPLQLVTNPISGQGQANQEQVTDGQGNWITQ